MESGYGFLKLFVIGFNGRQKSMSSLSFQDQVRHNPLDVTRAALCFAQDIAYPQLEVTKYLDELNALTEAARASVPAEASAAERASSLAEFLFQKEGFQGNYAEYMDPRNSFLNDVLDRRLGIPISLSVIYLHLGTRLGLPVGGVGLPGHFIVCVRGEAETVYLDPFNGGDLLEPDDFGRLVSDSTGYEGLFDQTWLRKSQPGEILTRMLNNLRGIYIYQEEWKLAVSVVEHLRIVRPEKPDYVRDLGLLLYQQGSLMRSIKVLSAYLKRNPDAPDTEEVQNCVRHICKELASLN